MHLRFCDLQSGVITQQQLLLLVPWKCKCHMQTVNNQPRHKATAHYPDLKWGNWIWTEASGTVCSPRFWSQNGPPPTTTGAAGHLGDGCFVFCACTKVVHQSCWTLRLWHQSTGPWTIEQHWVSATKRMLLTPQTAAHTGATQQDQAKILL